MKYSPVSSSGGVVQYAGCKLNNRNRYGILEPVCERSFPSELRMLAITQNRQEPSITLKVEFIGKMTGRKIDAEALIDSGAEGIIINTRFAENNHFTLLPINTPFPV